MISSLDIVKDDKYQFLFNKHFIFKGGRFVDNENTIKQGLYLNYDALKSSTAFDTLVRESYLFYTHEEAHFFLLHSPLEGKLTGTVIQISKELKIEVLGDNPINSVTDFQRQCIDIDEVIDIEVFLDKCKALFKGVSVVIDEDKAENHLFVEYKDIFK